MSETLNRQGIRADLKFFPDAAAHFEQGILN
jgi:hypothetical protein